jgi:LysM repeat protein
MAVDAAGRNTRAILLGMTAVDDDPRPSPAPVPDGATPGGSRRRDAGAVMEVCPLLESADGAWRSAYASRDHRCWAVRPPAPLALAKQRQLCLVRAHAGCATYQAARADGRQRQPGDDDGAVAIAASTLWPPVRSTPLALEPSRGRTGALPVASARAGGQTLLVALMVLAFLVLVIARTTSPSTPVTPGPSASADAAGLGGASVPAVSPEAPSPPSAGESPGAPATPSPATPSPTPEASTPAPTPVAATSPATLAPSSPAAVASPTPVPVGLARYTVKSGDTLSLIAARFGVTVKALADANGITNTRLIRVGQVLVIP